MDEVETKTRRLKVTKLYQKDLAERRFASDVYQVGEEKLSFSETNFYYTNRYGLIYGGSITDLPFVKSVLIATLESGEIGEDEFNKIRRIRGDLGGATKEGARKLVNEVRWARMKKELEEDAIRACARLTSGTSNS